MFKEKINRILSDETKEGILFVGFIAAFALGMCVVIFTVMDFVLF